MEPSDSTFDPNNEEVEEDNDDGKAKNLLQKRKDNGCCSTQVQT